MEATDNHYRKHWKRSFNILIPYIIIAGVFQYIGVQVAKVDFDKLHYPTSTVQDAIITIFGFLGTILTVWIFRVYIDKQTFSSLGFQTTNSRQGIFYGLLLGFVIMLIAFSGLLIDNQIEVSKIEFISYDFFLSVLIFVLVSVMEEVLLRGYILDNLLRSFDKFLSLVISAAIFSLFHSFNPNINWIGFLNLFLSGFLIGLLFIYTKQLWFPIALHFSWNFFQGTIFGFNVSGMQVYSIINIENQQNTIWNGGPFGFEGSILCVILQLISILIVFRIFNNRELKATEVESVAILSKL